MTERGVSPAPRAVCTHRRRMCTLPPQLRLPPVPLCMVDHAAARCHAYPLQVTRHSVR